MRREKKPLIKADPSESAPQESQESDNRTAITLIMLFATVIMCLGAVGLIIIGAIGINIMHNYKIYNYLYALPLTGNNGLGAASDPLLSIMKCTNFTGHPFVFEVENKEGYVLSYRCRETKNRCETALCRTNGTCAQIIIPGGQCASDTDCPDAYQCALDNCTCVPRKCATDADCPVLDNPCAAFVCNATSGACVEQLGVGATCSNSDQCATEFDDVFYRCNLTTCGCEFLPPLVLNASCLDNFTNPVPLNDCSQYVCADGRYVETLIPGAECAYSEKCQLDNNNTFYSCNSSCMCQFNQPELVNTTCDNNQTCPTSNLNSCSQFVCVAGRCEEQLISGATCAFDALCEQVNGTQYYCDLGTCMCQLRPFAIPTVTFVSNFGSNVLTGSETRILNLTSNHTYLAGDAFYTHAADPWSNLTFPDAAPGVDYYITHINVLIAIPNNPNNEFVRFWMGSTSFGSINGIVPGCSFQVQPSQSSDASIGNTCMFPGYPYGSSGIFLVMKGTGNIEWDLRDLPFSIIWTIQKIS